MEDCEKRHLKRYFRGDGATMATVEAREDETMLDADASAFCYANSGGGERDGEFKRPKTRNIYAHVQRRQWCVADGMYYAGGHRRVTRPADATKTLRAGNKRFVQELRLRETLEAHGGCVNCCSWNEDASLLISGSDDMTVCVWSCGAKMPLKGSTFTGHTHNVFACKFVPQTNDGACITTAADGDVRLVDLERGFRGPPPPHHGYRLRGVNQPDHECSRSLWTGRGAGMGFNLSLVPNEPNAFVATHQDGKVRLFDLRTASANGGSSYEMIVDLSAYGPTSEVAFDPTAPTMFAACSDDAHVRIFDLRHVKSARREAARENPACPSPSTSPTGAFMFPRSPRTSMNREIPCVMTLSPLELGQSVRSSLFEGISGIAYSSRGELAISCKGDDVYLIDTRRAAINLNMENALTSALPGARFRHQPAKRYVGRRNVKTFLKGVAFMCEDEYITTGGDDGSVFVWHKDTCELVSRIQADTQVVNTVLPHPQLPTIVCCGIDNHVRVFEAGDNGVHLGAPPERDCHSSWFEDDLDEDDDSQEEETDEDTDDGDTEDDDVLAESEELEEEDMEDVEEQTEQRRTLLEIMRRRTHAAHAQRIMFDMLGRRPGFTEGSWEAEVIDAGPSFEMRVSSDDQLTPEELPDVVDHEE